MLNDEITYPEQPRAELWRDPAARIVGVSLLGPGLTQRPRLNALCDETGNPVDLTPELPFQRTVPIAQMVVKFEQVSLNFQRFFS